MNCNQSLTYCQALEKQQRKKTVPYQTELKTTEVDPAHIELRPRDKETRDQQTISEPSHGERAAKTKLQTKTKQKQNQ